jgi:hypothetical protein
MRHGGCVLTGVVGDSSPRVGDSTQTTLPTSFPAEFKMIWTKPEAEVVAVTMEVTAYVATL